MGLKYYDRTVASLSAGQAAGTAPIITANPKRAGLKITPPLDCTLLVSSAGSNGVLLIGGLPNGFVREETPTNDLFVIGLTIGTKLVILEANEDDW